MDGVSGRSYRVTQSDVVIAGVLQNRYALGDLALYTRIILQVRRSLYILLGNTGDIYDMPLATSLIFQLLDLELQLHTGAAFPVSSAEVRSSEQGISYSTFPSVIRIARNQL